MRIYFFLCLFFYSFSSYSGPTIEDYGLLPPIQTMAVSPNGDLIAYRNVTTEKDIVFIVSLSQKKTISAIDVSAVKPGYLRFLNNERLYFRITDSKRLKGFRGEIDIASGMVMDVSTSKLKQLLRPGDGVVYPGQSRLDKIVGMSPDQKYLYMQAYSGNPSVVMGSQSSPPFALMRVNLKSGGKPRITSRGDDDAINFFINGQGDEIAREDYDDTTNMHRVLAKRKKKWVEIFSEKTPYRHRDFVGITPDEKHIVMIDESDETGRKAYYTLALADGVMAGPFHGRTDVDIDGVIVDIQKKVHGVMYSGLTPTYTFFDAKLNSKVKNIQESFPEHSVWLTDHSSDWQHILVHVEGSQAPGDYYLFSDGKEPIYITSSLPHIAPENINPIGKVTYTARDGLKIPTLFTLPRKDVENMKNLPAVIMPHGGPASYDSVGFNFMAQAFAEQGYFVIMPQFRGSSGFGAAHEVAGFGEWGGKMQDDLTDAVDFFGKKGIIDTQRVCIVGASYGGYAALAGGAFTPDLYKCVVSINGIGDLVSFRSWLRSERGRSSGSLAYWDTQIGNNDFSRDGAKARSPEYFAEAYSAPTLLIHGVEDDVVPIGQSRQMLKALKKANKEVELIELKGDDHDLSKNETRLESLRAMVGFLNKHLSL